MIAINSNSILSNYAVRGTADPNNNYYWKARKSRSRSPKKKLSRKSNSQRQNRQHTVSNQTVMEDENENLNSALSPSAQSIGVSAQEDSHHPPRLAVSSVCMNEEENTSRGAESPQSQGPSNIDWKLQLFQCQQDSLARTLEKKKTVDKGQLHGAIETRKTCMYDMINEVMHRQSMKKLIAYDMLLAFLATGIIVLSQWECRNKNFEPPLEYFRYAMCGIALLCSVIIVKRKLVLNRIKFRERLVESRSCCQKRIILSCLAEIILVSMFPYPFLDVSFVVTSLGQLKAYRLDDILAALSLLKVIYILRLIPHLTKHNSHQSQKIYEQNSVNVTNVLFFKIQLKEHPIMILCSILVLVTMTFGFALQIFERDNLSASGGKAGGNQDYEPFQDVSNSMWCVILGMTTVGYGDIVPLTIIGRLVVIAACFAGNFIITLLIVNLYSLIMHTHQEYKACSYIDSIEARAQLKIRARNLIIAYINRRRMRGKVAAKTKGAPLKYQSTSHTKEIYQAKESFKTYRQIRFYTESQQVESDFSRDQLASTERILDKKFNQIKQLTALGSHLEPGPPHRAGNETLKQLQQNSFNLQELMLKTTEMYFNSLKIQTLVENNKIQIKSPVSKHSPEKQYPNITILPMTNNRMNEDQESLISKDNKNLLKIPEQNEDEDTLQSQRSLDKLTKQKTRGHSIQQSFQDTHTQFEIQIKDDYIRSRSERKSRRKQSLLKKKRKSNFIPLDMQFPQSPSKEELNFRKMRHKLQIDLRKLLKDNENMNNSATFEIPPLVFQQPQLNRVGSEKVKNNQLELTFGKEFKFGQLLTKPENTEAGQSFEVFIQNKLNQEPVLGIQQMINIDQQRLKQCNKENPEDYSKEIVGTKEKMNEGLLGD